jgi:hypothetical protein
LYQLQRLANGICCNDYSTTSPIAPCFKLDEHRIAEKLIACRIIMQEINMELEERLEMGVIVMISTSTCTFMVLSWDITHRVISLGATNSVARMKNLCHVYKRQRRGASR